MDHRPPPVAGVIGGARTTKRRGRLDDEARAALRDLAPTWTVDPDGPWTAAVLDAAFGRSARRLLDIGAGNGEAALAVAARQPDWDVVAVELHRPGIARLLRHLDGGTTVNLRVVEADVTRLLDGSGPAVQPGTFAAWRILFPDPWPKRRHLGRRLVDEAFVRRAGDLLPAGGSLHVATDWDDYADQVRAALAADDRFVPDVADSTRSTNGSWRSERPSRPVTAYEQRGLDAGRTITDLLARRV